MLSIGPIFILSFFVNSNSFLVHYRRVLIFLDSVVANVFGLLTCDVESH